MNYTVWGHAPSPGLQEFAEQLSAAMERAGFTRTADVRDVNFVLNLIDATDPKPFRRKSRGTFVAAMHELSAMPKDVLTANYPLLVRALANIVLCYVPGHGVWFVTPERGHYGVLSENGEAALADAVVERERRPVAVGGKEPVTEGLQLAGAIRPTDRRQEHEREEEREVEDRVADVRHLEVDHPRLRAAQEHVLHRVVTVDEAQPLGAQRVPVGRDRGRELGAARHHGLVEGAQPLLLEGLDTAERLVE